MRLLCSARRGGGVENGAWKMGPTSARGQARRTDHQPDHGACPTSEIERPSDRRRTCTYFIVAEVPPEIDPAIQLNIPTISYGGYASFRVVNHPHLTCMTSACVLKHVRGLASRQRALMDAVTEQQACVHRALSPTTLRRYYNDLFELAWRTKQVEQWRAGLFETVPPTSSPPPPQPPSPPPPPSSPPRRRRSPSSSPSPTPKTKHGFLHRVWTWLG